MKRFGIILLIFLIGIAGAVYWALGRMDATLAGVIETTGTDLLGVPVSVRGVQVRLREGQVSIQGIRVANPQGEGLNFSKEPAFTLEGVTVALDLERLNLSDPLGTSIPLRLVDIVAPVVNAEVIPAGINLDVLRKRLGARSGSSTSTQGSSGEEIRLEIGEFRFAEGELRADTSAVGGEKKQLALPALQLQQLRGSPAEVGRKLLDAFLASALRQLARDEVSSRVDEELEKAKAKAVDKLRSVLGVEEKP